MILDYISSFFIGVFYPMDNITQTQLYLMRFSMIIVFDIIIFIIINLIYSKENEMRISMDNAELKYSNLEAEFFLLKQQINPHF
jgi:uncharacterized membrane protein